jgi:hypothetical protein
MSGMNFGSGVARACAHFLILVCGVFASTAALPTSAHDRVQRRQIGSAAQTRTTNSAGTSHESKIPIGTILPVVLRTSFELDRCKPGEPLYWLIAQEVPLPTGATIRRGSRIDRTHRRSCASRRWNRCRSLNAIRQIEYEGAVDSAGHEPENDRGLHGGDRSGRS